MKVLYIEAQKSLEQDINLKALSKLPKQLLLLYSIQYRPLALIVKKHLGSKVKGFKQVLGCTKLKTNLPILLVGSGRFHANNLAYQNNTPIYIYTGQKLETIDKQQIARFKAKRKAAILRFLSENKIGILVSTKPGQNKLKDAKKIKKQLEKKGKKAYIFMANNLNLSEIENFKINSWINTACPGLAFDHTNIVNSEDIKQFL